jgi:hypothetical protein
MKKNSRHFYMTFSGLMLLTASLFADPAVEVGSRPLTPETQAMWDQQKNAEWAKKEESNPGFSGRSLEQALGAYQRTNIPFYGYNSSFSTHWINTISAYGDTIEIEDGSWWKISSSDSYTALSWRPGDQVSITPNSGWFSSYTYCLTNRNTGSYVKANLNVGPVAYGANSHWINSIDYLTGHVFLENGTCWCISNNDSYIFREWAPNDCIIIGLNDSWFTSYDHILINVNMNTFLRAKQY